MIALEAGAIIDDRYQLIRQLGEGGMGSVYVATEMELNRQVAIKLLHSGLIQDEEHRSRFEREGKILSGLSHPNVLTFYRFGMLGTRVPFIAMEYIDGLSLREMIDQNMLNYQQFLDMSQQIAGALQFAHNKNIVHRDIKPTNILIEKHSGTVKLLDFGLARVTELEAKQNLTQTGDLIGSVYYMSPEQCTGKKVDARADIYSFGCVMYEMCTGAQPFASDNPIGLMHKHATQELPGLKPRKDFAIPENMVIFLEAIIRKCMEKLPEDRYQTMGELSKDLALLSRGKTDELNLPAETAPTNTSARRTKLAIAGTIALSIIAIASVCWIALKQKSTTAATTQSKLVRTPQKALGAQARLRLLLRQPPSPQRYAEIKKFIALVEDGEILQAEDFRNLYLAYCIEAFNYPESTDCVKHLEFALNKRMQAIPHGLLTASLWDHLSRHYLRLGGFRQAEAAARNALRLYNEEPEMDLARESTALRTVSIACRRQGKFCANESVLRKLFDSVREQTPAIRLTVGPVLAEVYLRRGDQHAEDSLFNQMLPVLRQASYEDKLRYLQDLFSVYSDLHKNSLCLRRIPMWMEIACEDKKTKAIALFQGGECLFNAGYHAEAQSCFDQAAAVVDPGDKHFQSCLYTTVARVRLLQQRNEEAIAAAQRGLDIKSSSSFGYLSALANACAVARKFAILELVLSKIDSDYQQAQISQADYASLYRTVTGHFSGPDVYDLRGKYIRRCIENIAKTGRPSDRVWDALLNLELVAGLIHKNEYESAQKIVDANLKFTKLTPLHEQLWARRLALSTLLHKGVSSKTTALTQESVKLAQMVPHAQERAEQMKRLASCYIDMNYLREGEDILKEALAESKNDAAAYRYMLMTLSRFYRSAYKDSKKAIAILNLVSMPSSIKDISSADLLFWAQREEELGRAYVFDQTHEAQTHYMRAVELVERIDAPNLKETIYLDAAASLLPPYSSLSNPSKQFETLLNKARSNGSDKKVGMSQFANILEAVYMHSIGQKGAASKLLNQCVKSSEDCPGDETWEVLTACEKLFTEMKDPKSAQHCHELAKRNMGSKPSVLGN